MDTSDPDIRFDANGVCNHCSGFLERWRDVWLPNDQGTTRLVQHLTRVKRAGNGRSFDCALGLSGGADSSYLVLKAFEWGLRPLVVHVDTGWNSDEAVSNIERLLRHCGFTLHTHVVDWEEMRDLQLAYLRSGISNQDVPQDHAIFASLYACAVNHGVKTVVSGSNIATEGIFPQGWHGDNMDLTNLRAIHRRFGVRALKNYPQIGLLKRYIVNPYVHGLRVFAPLNLMPYDRDKVVRELQDACGWRPYGRKHGESRFTKLFQNHILPVRFGFDKRRPHLSSMIASGQMSREEAIRRLAEPLYDACELEEDVAFFCNKLGISEREFEAFMVTPCREYTYYANHDQWYAIGKWIQRKAVSLVGLRISPSVR